jgi:hypothetical protein
MDATDVERQAYSHFLQGFSRRGDGAAGRRFTMRDAIKIAGSVAVRTGELQANTRPSSGFVQVVADRDDVVGDLPVCTPSPDLDL